LLQEWPESCLLAGGTVKITSLVPAGRFTLHSAVHPCDGNCSHLDAPLRCTASLGIGARELTTATVVIEAARRCRFTVTSPRPPTPAS
jgi:hypothetical protein